MSDDRERRTKLLFDRAIELAGEERRAYLDAACDGDADLGRRVWDLLAAAEKDDRFLRESPRATGLRAR